MILDFHTIIIITLENIDCYFLSWNTVFFLLWTDILIFQTGSSDGIRFFFLSDS